MIKAMEPFVKTTVDALLRRQAEIYTDRPFILYEDQVWSYEQVESRASSLAAGLRHLGLAPGDRLAVLLPNSPDYMVTLFGAAWAGLILVPINTRRSNQEVHSRLSITRPRAVITSSDAMTSPDADPLENVLSARAKMPDLEHIIVLKGGPEQTVSWDDLMTTGAPTPEPASRPEDPMAVVHTLGSSGEPRGATLIHQGVVRNAAALASIMECKPEDVFLGCVPFSNAFGLTPTILACTVSGALMAPLRSYDPAKALDLIETAQVTIHHGVPTMFALELNHPAFDPQRCSSLRTGIMAGAACPPELVRRVREETGMNLILAYGLTEASPSVTTTRLDDGPVTGSETVGRPMDGIEIKVIGPDGSELPPGQEGELCARGYNIKQGYREDPEATAEVLDEDGWLHTSDLAVIDPDGPVRILGRKDEVINRGGLWIHPGTVEMVLRSYPGVKEAAVVAIPDFIFGDIACACVVRAADADFQADALLAFASEHLASYAVPDRVLFFHALPRERGVVRKDSLSSQVRNRGQAWKFGKNIDTDAIIPARRCNTADPVELAKYCMEDADPEFVHKMRRGDLIVAESNFGCGSSREVAPLCIKAAGVSAVIAKSFARIFFRNAINIGLPILECPEAVDGIQERDEIEVEPATGTIRNLSRGTTYQATPYPPFLQRIIQQGGLLPYVEERLSEGKP